MTTCISNVVGANPCEHGGRCLNTKGSFQCKCLQGYEGPRCEMDVNECMSNPCHNDATCLDQIGGFHCICMPGKSIGLYRMGREKGKGKCRDLRNFGPLLNPGALTRVRVLDLVNNSFLLMCLYDFRI